MWLTGNLTPDFKNIANFRKDNCGAISNVCRQVVVLCQRLRLFSDALVALTAANSEPSTTAIATSPAPSCNGAWKRSQRASTAIVSRSGLALSNEQVFRRLHHFKVDSQLQPPILINDIRGTRMSLLTSPATLIGSAETEAARGCHQSDVLNV